MDGSRSQFAEKSPQGGHPHRSSRSPALQRKVGRRRQVVLDRPDRTHLQPPYTPGAVDLDDLVEVIAEPLAVRAVTDVAMPCEYRRSDGGVAAVGELATHARNVMARTREVRADAIQQSPVSDAALRPEVHTVNHRA